jgi:PRMT5 oligomerisation domain/Ribosomal protein L11 methyltransferase (PrmA)
MRIEYHRTLIADRVRNDAFHAALKRVIIPGETVVADIGAGTGLLALMAAKLGAKAVYLYEAAEVAGVAAAVLKANRTKNCHLMPCHSTEMQDPPQVDLIVSETLGNYALEENIIATLVDGRKRFLKLDGVIIPRRIAQFVAPVVSKTLHTELTIWDSVGHGIDLTAARHMSLNNVYVRQLKGADLLQGTNNVRQWDEIDLARETKSSRKGDVTWRIAKPATIYGFAVWWTLDLVEGITLSTAPDAPRTHWEQLYFPLETPIICKSDESIMVSLRSRSSEAEGTHLAWTAVHSDTAGRSLTRQSMDLDKGWIP